MGYYTRFDLEIKTRMTRERAEQIVNRLNELMDWEAFTLYCDERPLSEEGNIWYTEPYDEMKWYNWEETMITLASEFPDVEFRLEGNGEEKDDWWIALFKGDRRQIKYCEPPIEDWED